jgi:hypothetical protein
VLNEAKSRQIIHYTKGQTKPLLYYLDLGLTSTGSNHYELPIEVLQYGISTEKMNEVVKKDLKKRLSTYHVGIALNKFKRGYEAGDFGWQAERVISEKKLVRNSITKRFIDSHLGQVVRQHIFSIDGSHKNAYSLILQVTYLMVIFEGLLALINLIVKNIEMDKISMYLLITIFGMFLYFALFEFGRSRYLISFWPLIVSLSAIPYLKTKGSKVEVKSDTK